MQMSDNVKNELVQLMLITVMGRLGVNRLSISRADLKAMADEFEGVEAEAAVKSDVAFFRLGDGRHEANLSDKAVLDLLEVAGFEIMRGEDDG